MKIKGEHTLIVTFIHPGVVWNISNLKSTIQNQTYRKFDVLLVLDEIHPTELDFPAEWQVLSNHYKFDIPTLRYIAIQYAAKHNYEYIIFIDGDDSMSLSRVEVILDNFKGFDFIVNEIVPVDKSGDEIGAPVLRDLFLSPVIADFKTIFDRNLIGLSNSAIRVPPVKGVKIPNIIIAVDWYLFTVLLLENYRGYFVEKTNTYYTQYDANTVGLSGSFTSDTIRYYLDVKIRHFYALELFGRNTQNKWYKDIRMYLDDLLVLSKLLENDSKLSLYKKLITSENLEFKGWWDRLKVSKEIINELVSENKRK